jgi:choline dehydrogenase
VAERLSADRSCSVTVVEAGPPLSVPDVRMLVSDGSVLPIGAASPLVQRFETVLTERPHRTTHIVRGSVVGGSGAVNGGYFCRGLPGDFDSWELPGWRWTDVLGHFRDIETDLDFDGPAHGRTGPIPVSRTAEITGSTQQFIDGALRAGFDWFPDLNGAVTDTDTQAGVGPVPLNIAAGTRAGPGSAILHPALDRPNLVLHANTTVRRLQVSAGRAVGVDAEGPYGAVSLTAERIVLCAGAIGTAKILMLAGIGDESVLRHVGIAPNVTAPVGMHCVDHPEWVMQAAWATTPGHPVLEAILCTDFDVEIRPYTGGFIAMVGDGSAGRPDWPHVGVALMQPQSRGRVTVVSADPDVAPRIEHRYDAAPSDVAALRRGSELAQEVCSPRELSEPLWSTSQHLCATVPMGTERDERAVLDPQCRVRGVERLWVIDGAALPAITSRGPHASIVMFAHRAAEFVVAG